MGSIVIENVDLYKNAIITARGCEKIEGTVLDIWFTYDEMPYSMYVLKTENGWIPYVLRHGYNKSRHTCSFCHKQYSGKNCEQNQEVKDAIYQKLERLNALRLHLLF